MNYNHSWVSYSYIKAQTPKTHTLALEDFKSRLG